VYRFKCFQRGLPLGFADRQTLCVQLVFVRLVIGPTAAAVAGLQYDLRPPALLGSMPKSASAVITPQRGHDLG
jgi:hypothetical protein